MKIIAVEWRSGGNSGTIGIVACEKINGKWKAYYGISKELDPQFDAEYIAAHGGSVPTREAATFFPNLDISKYAFVDSD